MKSKFKTKFALMFLFISVAVLTSCKKHLSTDSASAPEQHNIERLAVKINGKIHTGNIMSSRYEDGVILNINDGDKLVFLQSLPGDIHEIDPVAATTWIESDHGVITVDKASGQIFLYANNDVVSRQLFGGLCNSLSKNTRLVTVFGYTIVKGIIS